MVKLPVSGTKITLLGEIYENNPADITALGVEAWPYWQDHCLVIKPSVSDLFAVSYDGIINDPRTPDANRQQAKDRKNSLNSDTAWYGGKEADMLARKRGWPEGVKQMLEIIDRIFPEYGYAERPRPSWNADDGYEIDWDRWKDSNAKPYISRKIRRGSKHLSIGIQFNNHGGYNSKAFFYRGAACVAAVDTLEDMGYRVEVVTVASSSNMYIPGPFKDYTGLPNGHNSAIVRVEVKKAYEPLDLDYLASTIASPMFFRGNLFCLRTAMPFPPESNMGMPYSAVDPDRLELFVDDLPTDEEDTRALYTKIVKTALDKSLHKRYDPILGVMEE